jgi:anti-sigma B factor antagonist
MYRRGPSERRVTKISGDPPQFEVALERDGTVATILVRGELDIATTPALEAAFARLEPGYQTLVVDLTECTFFASSGISLLLEHNARAKEEGIEFVVVKAPSDVQRMFDLLGLDQRLTFIEQRPA